MPRLDHDSVLIVGPHTPLLFADHDRVHTLSELGVILLMFALGLEFSIRKLIRLGPTSGFITALQVGLMIWLGFMCGRAMGWTPLESIFTGALLSISSTTIVAKAYQETPVAEHLRELVFGVLLAEDLTAVIELAVLTTLASGASVSAPQMTVTVARLILFLVALVGIGILIVPPAVRLVVRIGRAETTLVASVGICFAFALLAERAGYSVALGAFLAGSLVAESGEAQQIEHLIAPLRDIFGAVFFVSVGMMIDPALIAEHWVALALLTMTVIVGKVAGVSIAAVLSGIDTKTSIEAGMSLAQIGEFSFIIAGVGLQLHATRDFIYTLAIAVSAITTFLTPYMIRLSGPVAECVAVRIPRPLRVFESLYDSWMEQMRWPKLDDARHPSLGWPVMSIAASAILIGGILILNELDPLDVTTAAANLERISYFDAGLFVDLFALLLCLGPMAGLYFSSQRLAIALAIRAIPQVANSHSGAATALIELLQVTILLVVVIPLLAIVQPFIGPFEGIAVVVIAVVLMTLEIARCMMKVQGHMRGAAGLIADALAGSHAHSKDGQAYTVPGLGTLTPVRVRSDFSGVGKTLADLDLHGTTGALVVAIGRGDGEIIVPTGKEVIREGDVLELAGSETSVRAAKRALHNHSRGTGQLAASV